MRILSAALLSVSMMGCATLEKAHQDLERHSKEAKRRYGCDVIAIPLPANRGLCIDAVEVTISYRW